jgi:hypothetical protein
MGAGSNARPFLRTAPVVGRLLPAMTPALFFCTR